MKKPNTRLIDDVQQPRLRKNTSQEPVESKSKSQKRRLHEHPLVVPVVTFLVLFFISIFGYISLNGQTIGASDSRIVLVTVEGKSDTLPTRAKTVQEFIDRAKIEINKGDVVEPALSSEIDEDDFRINIYRARPVTVFDGEKRIQTLSAAKTPRSVASQAGLTVYPEDDVQATKPPEQILREGVIGETVVIDRATAAHLNLYGTQVDVRTRAKTVGDLLSEKQIKLGQDDTVQPAIDTVLTPSTQVFVTRVGTQIVSTEEDIAMPVEKVEDPNLSFGAVAVRQQGSPGKKIVTYQIETKNGVEVGRKAIQEVVVSAPVKQIEARGKAYTVPEDKSGLLAAAGISLSDYPYVNHIIGRESGWCATK